MVFFPVNYSLDKVISLHIVHDNEKEDQRLDMVKRVRKNVLLNHVASEFAVKFIWKFFFNYYFCLNLQIVSSGQLRTIIHGS
jgi:hypothetical protein